MILKSPRTFVWSSNSLSPVSPVPAMRLEGDMAGEAQGAGHEAATMAPQQCGQCPLDTAAPPPAATHPRPQHREVPPPPGMGSTALRSAVGTYYIYQYYYYIYQNCSRVLPGPVCCK